jgi:hypothetical protein
VSPGLMSPRISGLEVSAETGILRLLRVDGLLYATVDPVTFDSLRVTSPPMAATAFLLPSARPHPPVQLIAVKSDGSARTKRLKVARFDRTPQGSSIDVAVSRGPCIVEVRALRCRRLHASASFLFLALLCNA